MCFSEQVGSVCTHVEPHVIIHVVAAATSRNTKHVIGSVWGILLDVALFMREDASLLVVFADRRKNLCVVSLLLLLSHSAQLL